jgi:hypothetical protein
MRTFLKAGLVWSGILLSFACYSQTIPLGALPMQYNPSFAGEAGGPRFSSNFGLNADGSIRNNSYAFNTSFDQFIPAIRSGIGFSGGYYSTSSNRFFSSSGYSFALAVAPKFSLKGKYTVSPSLDLSYGAADQIFKNRPNATGDQQINGFNLQSRAGLLANTRKWYVGYALEIPLRNAYRYRGFDGLVIPSSSDTTLSVTKRFNSYWQFGYTFQRSPESKFSFTPQIVFKTGHDGFGLGWNGEFRYFTPVVFNLNFRYNKFIWGINNTGVHLGWQTDRIRVMLSNGFGYNGRESGYTGNATFRYMLKQNDR